MITYYIYSGDNVAANTLTNFVFKEGRFLSKMEDFFHNKKYGSGLKKILIRLYVDGDIMIFKRQNSISNYSKKTKRYL